MTDPARVLEAALELSETEQEKLLEALATNLYGTNLGEEWEVEIRVRMDDIDAGKVELLPGTAVFDRLARKFGA